MCFLSTCDRSYCLCSAALRLAGITAQTVAPAGGAIDIDLSTGEPTGILREAAIQLCSNLFTETEAETRKYITAGLQFCLQNGLTCVQPNDTRTWHVYKQLYDAGELPIRVFLTINQDEIYDTEAISKGTVPKAGELYGSDDMLSCHRVKLFADGALGPHTAALSKPYVVPHRW